MVFLVALLQPQSGSWLFFIVAVLLLTLTVDAFNLRSPASISRRDLFFNSAVGAAGSLLLPSQPAFAATQQPIAILGANGRTGSLCVAACLSRGWPVRALTRSGSWTPPPGEDGLNNKLLAVAACDVKDSNALTSSLKGCQGVVYAASASKLGGTAKEIDNDGVVAAASVCLASDIARYVVISSTATTRPKSLGYVFTNVFGGIMEQKRLGEEGVQMAYKNNAGGTSSYSIIRPGGLEEPKKNEVVGPKSLEISQGDTLAGIISRADLAEVAVELAASNAANLRDTALELYYADSAQPCENRFKSMMTNGVIPRLNGFSTYAELVGGVKPGIDYYVPS